MYFTLFIALAAAVFAAPAFLSPTKRQGLPIVTLESPGSITAPSDGAVVEASQPFAFSVAVPEWNHCHPGYTPVTIYLLDYKPTTSDLNSTYGFSDYLYFYGDYLVNNFPGALPPMGTLPPSSLDAPEVAASGKVVHLATIEIIGGCPPDGYTEYAIDSVALTYA